MIRPLRTSIALALASLAVFAVSATGAPKFGLATSTPSGWNRTNQVTVEWGLAWPGAEGIRFEIADIDDSFGTVRWQTVASTSPLPSLSGQVVLPLGGREGRRALRVVAWDASGSTERFVDTLLLDRTAPRSQRVELRRRPTSTLVTWHQDDSGGSGTTAQGWADVETSPGTWRSTPINVNDGPADTLFDLAGLPEGSYPARLRTADLAGNTATTDLPKLWVDTSPPLVTGVAAHFNPTATTIQLTYSAQDELSGVPLSAPGHIVDALNGSPIEVFTGGPDAQAIVVDRARIGTQPIMIQVTDAAGNVGRSAPFTLTGSDPLSGAGSISDPRERELRSSRIDARVIGTHNTLRQVNFGHALTVAGTLSTVRMTPLPQTEIEVRDRTGAVLGRTLTRADGAFALRVVPRRNGSLRIGVPLGDELLPPGAVVGPKVQLVPRVTLRASARVARAGGPAVVFTGRMQPSPRSLGIAAKNVVVEWRDPIRKTWRPMVNTQVTADGRVRVPWRFGAGGFTVPVRLRVPAERAWPTAAGLSRAVSVTVQ